MATTLEPAMITFPSNDQFAYHDQVQYNDSLPPWEQRNRPMIVQVPFLSPSAPPSMQSEHHERSAMRITKARKHEPQHHLDSIVSVKRSHRDGDTIPAGPLTAPPPASTSPYDTKTSRGPRTSPNLPTFVKSSSPFSPVNDFNSSYLPTQVSSKLHSEEAPPIPGLPMPVITPLEGTTGIEEKERIYDGALFEDDVATRTFLQRLRTSFKNMFKRPAIDDGDFEHIPDCHWTEQ